jgi:MFS family permease
MPVLMLSRVLHGAAAAFCSPVANSLISDAFSEEQRGVAYSVYVSGLYAGTALAILSGSASALSRAAMPAASLGWRACAQLLGAFALLAALVLALTVREPARATRARPVVVGQADGVPGEMRQFVSQGIAGVALVLSCRPALLSLCAVAMRLCAGFTIASWFPLLCKARFPGEERAFATMYASIVCLGGMAASILGGLASDAIRRRSTLPNARAVVPLVGSLLAAPLFAMAVTRSTLHSTMAWFLAHVLCSECWLGPTIATMLDSLPADARGTAQGLSNFVQIGGGLLQSAIAPAVAQFGLARALQATVPTAYVLSAGVFLAVLFSRPSARKKTA